MQNFGGKMLLSDFESLSDDCSFPDIFIFNFIKTRSVIECGSVCSSSIGCSAFHFSKVDQTCSIGSLEDLTYAAAPNAQLPVHVDMDYTAPDYGQ